jgi:hypothetical protein
VINIEVTIAQEPYEGNVELLRYVYRKARWSSYSSNHRNPTHQGFLQKLEAGASGQQTYVQTNIISGTPGAAAVTDPTLINPWGVSVGPAIWIDAAGSGLVKVDSCNAS